MHILFTGGSSFTGYWFIQELVKAGYGVTATFQGEYEDYVGIKRQRVDKLRRICDCRFKCSFGGQFFQKLMREKKWLFVCHHGAYVGKDYKESLFPVFKALHNNSACLVDILEIMSQMGSKKLLLTGSVFEPGEGEGTDLLPAVSAYGLSKGLTSEVFKYYCSLYKVQLSKFVIPNPFGIYEEPKFTSYLAHSWLHGVLPEVKTPDYVRDNIPVQLLAKAYVAFLEGSERDSALYRCFSPSCYKESQRHFTERFANEMEKRLSVPCPYKVNASNDLHEPKERTNKEVLNWELLNFNEEEFWDDLAIYYQETFH